MTDCQVEGGIIIFIFVTDGRVMLVDQEPDNSRVLREKRCLHMKTMASVAYATATHLFMHNSLHVPTNGS